MFREVSPDRVPGTRYRRARDARVNLICGRRTANLVFVDSAARKGRLENFSRAELHERTSDTVNDSGVNAIRANRTRTHVPIGRAIVSPIRMSSEFHSRVSFVVVLTRARTAFRHFWNWIFVRGREFGNQIVGKYGGRLNA